MRALLSQCEDHPYTYEEVGATRTEPPTVGYAVDRWGTQLGRGEEVWQRATQAVRDFAMYPPAWTQVFRSREQVEEGLVFVTAIRHLGIWSLNPCRILYVVDEKGDAPRFGFALGTLEGHAEMGEERFLISWDRARDLVRYEVLGFSRPKLWFVRLGAPIARMYQKRFHRDSVANMLRVVAG